MESHIFTPTAMIDDYIIQPRKEPRRPREVHRYWPTDSSVSFRNQYDEKEVIGTCLRKLYYAFTREEESNPIDARGLRILRIGKLIEEQEIDWARNLPFFLDHNVKFEYQLDNLTISGEVDALYQHPKTKQTIGIEYKTGYGYHWHKEIFGNTKKKGMPKLEHVLQVMLYLEFFKSIPYFIIVYIDRGDLDRIEHRVTIVRDNDPMARKAVINDKVLSWLSVGKIYQRIRELDNLLEQKKLPEQDYELFYSSAKVEHLWKDDRISKSKYDKHKKGHRTGAWQCAYCPFLKKCYNLEKP